MGSRSSWIAFVWLGLVCGSVWAGTCVWQGEGGLALQISSAEPLQPTPQGAIVRGEIVVTPLQAIGAGICATYYMDERPVLASFEAQPELRLDTRRWSEGAHTLRLEGYDGTRLAFSSGPLALHIANETAANLAVQAIPPAIAGFTKLYRKAIWREAVFFNGREADLEKHAFLQRGRLYITLTDLIRHIGGTIIWGPTGRYVHVERQNIKVQVRPGSRQLLVNGVPVDLGRPTFRLEDRLYVPLRPMLAIFGLQPDWNYAQRRAYVNTK